MVDYSHKLDGKIKKETDRAILFTMSNGNDVWFPKSQIQILTENIIIVSQWIYDQNSAKIRSNNIQSNVQSNVSSNVKPQVQGNGIKGRAKVITPKAILWIDNATRSETWYPKSQCTLSNNDSILTPSAWIAEKKSTQSKEIPKSVPKNEPVYVPPPAEDEMEDWDGIMNNEDDRSDNGNGEETDGESMPFIDADDFPDNPEDQPEVKKEDKKKDKKEIKKEDTESTIDVSHEW